MTWAEAKAKSGIGSGKGKSTKQQQIGKRESHGKLLAAKIVAKHSDTSTETVIDSRQAAKLAKKDQQRQKQLDAKRQAEKEQQRLDAVAKPHQQAIQKLHEYISDFPTSALSAAASKTTTATSEKDQWALICESKQMQCDEIMALQAMLNTDDDVNDENIPVQPLLVVHADSKLEDMQQKIEEWQCDMDNERLQESIVHHPPISFALQRSIPDMDDDDWVAHLYVIVTFPPKYPMESSSMSSLHIDIPWFLITQPSLVVAENKPLQSLRHLDTKKLLAALTEQQREISSDGIPIVYELLDTWLMENLFEYVE